MSTRSWVSNVAGSTPYDGSSTGYGDDVQEAIDNVGALITGKPRAVVTCGYNGNANSGRDLEFHHSGSTTFTAAEPGRLVAFSANIKSSSTITFSVTVAGSVVDTLVITADTKGSKSGISYPFLADEDISVEVTSGSGQDPAFFLSIEIDL